MRFPTENRVIRGLVSGCVATVAYTAASALLRARFDGSAAPEGGASASADRPAAVAAELTGRTGRRRGQRVLDTAVHWGYGTACGTARVFLDRRGVHGWRADAAHLAVVWLPWRVLLTARDLRRGSGAPEPRTLVHELVKHGVYALVAGRVYALLEDRAARERVG